MKAALCIGTAHGLLLFERTQQDWRESSGKLTGRQFTTVAGRNQALLAGTVDGIFRSDDFGQTWWESSKGLTRRHIRWLAYHPEEGGPAFAGTEPAAIFISHDQGQSWHECPEVAKLRDENEWNLPYSPEAGCVRGFAFKGARGYAAVEQGGLLRSDNRGETWYLAEGSTGKPDAAIPESFIHPDVHSVQIRPSSADQVFAPTGGGLYRSLDGGISWTHLYRCYCRAIWLDPADPGHLIFGPADGVDTNGRIEESIDGGETWEPAMNGLEESWPNHMVERFAQFGDELVAVLSNGEMIAAPLETLGWRRILPAIQGVKAVAPMTI